MILYFSEFSENHYFRFSSLPDLPPNTGYSFQPGLAGTYTGIDDGATLVIGIAGTLFAFFMATMDVKSL